jgi:kynureninase
MSIAAAAAAAAAADDERALYLPIDPDAVLDAAVARAGAGATLSSRATAAALDALPASVCFPGLRSDFLFPRTPATASVRAPGSDCIYLCGNSLGLQCRGVRVMLGEELDKWSRFGVEGHFESPRPWVTVDELCVESMARVVGAKPVEVCLMNTLTANLHTLMTSFYRPEAVAAAGSGSSGSRSGGGSGVGGAGTRPRRFKILAESKSFPSDKFAFLSQIRLHGLDPAEALIELSPREGEDTLRTEDVLAVLEREVGGWVGKIVAACAACSID